MPTWCSVSVWLNYSSVVIERCTGIAEVTGLTPVEAQIFFSRLSLQLLKNFLDSCKRSLLLSVKRILTRGGGGGGCSKDFCTGRLHPDCQPLTQNAPLFYTFDASGRRFHGGVLPSFNKAEFPVFRRFFFPGFSWRFSYPFKIPKVFPHSTLFIDPLKYLKNVISLYPFLYLDSKNTPLSGGASPYSRS